MDDRKRQAKAQQDQNAVLLEQVRTFINRVVKYSEQKNSQAHPSKPGCE